MSNTKIVNVPIEYAEQEARGDNALLAAFIGREILRLAGQTLEVETCDSVQKVTLRYAKPGDSRDMFVDMNISLQMESPFTRSVRASREGGSH